MSDIITCTPEDSIRIRTGMTATGTPLHVRLPASLILAADEVLRYERIAKCHLSLSSYRMGDDREFEARLGTGIGSVRGRGATPWAAVKAMADVLAGEAKRP